MDVQHVIAAEAYLKKYVQKLTQKADSDPKEISALDAGHKLIQLNLVLMLKMHEAKTPEEQTALFWRFADAVNKG